MNPRERLLAIMTAALVGLLGLYGTWTTVNGWFETANARLANARRELKKKKEELNRIQVAAQKLASFEQQSLPRSPDVAQTLYQSWLLAQGKEAGLANVEIKTTKPRATQRTFVTLTYTLRAQGEWSQWLRWLHAFDSHEVLHRIDTYSWQPIRDSRRLEGVLTIAAVCVNSAPAVTEWNPARKSDVPEFLAHMAPVLQRNFFFPPNQSPRLENGGEQRAYVGKAWDWSPKGADPDPFDRVQYKLVESEISDLQFDEKSSRASWKSPQKGKYKIEFSLSDDGWPPREVKQTIQLVVTDPPPPPVEPPKKLAFDLAKVTYLTAIVSSGEIREAWLQVRPTGEIKRIRAGDTISIGSIEGRAKFVDDDDLLFESQGALRKLTRGGILFDAPVADAKPGEPAASE